MRGESIKSGQVPCVRYLPSGELLAIATFQIFKFIIQKPSLQGRSVSLAWTLDGTHLLSAGDSAIRVDSSASSDMHVCLWWLSDRQAIALFRHLSPLRSLTSSSDGKHILSGGDDKKISDWTVPSNANSKASFYS
jgi:WD40 repeat protein